MSPSLTGHLVACEETLARLHRPRFVFSVRVQFHHQLLTEIERDGEGLQKVTNLVLAKPYTLNPTH